MSARRSRRGLRIYRWIGSRYDQTSICRKLNGRGKRGSSAPPWRNPPRRRSLERPEVAEVAFVLRNIGAMDAEDIDGDNVDLRFEDAEGRDTGCDVSIVEYAEKAADLLEQRDRIVGEPAG